MYIICISPFKTTTKPYLLNPVFFCLSKEPYWSWSNPLSSGIVSASPGLMPFPLRWRSGFLRWFQFWLCCWWHPEIRDQLTSWGLGYFILIIYEQVFFRTIPTWLHLWEFLVAHLPSINRPNWNIPIWLGWALLGKFHLSKPKSWRTKILLRSVQNIPIHSPEINNKKIWK